MNNQPPTNNNEQPERFSDATYSPCSRRPDAGDAFAALLFLGSVILLGGLITLICGGGPLP